MLRCRWRGLVTLASLFWVFHRLINQDYRMSRWAHTTSDRRFYPNEFGIYQDLDERVEAPLPTVPYSHRNYPADCIDDNEQKMAKILMVFSSAPRTLTGNHEAGWYLPEAAHVCVSSGPILFI